MSINKKKGTKDQLEQKKEGVLTAEILFIEGFNLINDKNLVKQEMILSYIKELSIGQVIKKNDLLTYNLCGKKQNTKIIDVKPINEQNQWLIDQKTKFEIFTHEQLEKQDQQMAQREEVKILYQDELIDQINSIINISTGKQYQIIKQLELPQTKGFLITGQSGTGKSLFLEKINQQFHTFKPYLIKINTYENNLKDLLIQLDKALIEKSRLILLDDLGALDEENQAKFKVNLMRLFDEIGDQQIIIIATTSSIKDIPDQLRRSGRFEKEIIIELPNHEKRAQILQIELQKIKFDVEQEILKELSYQMSGFNINDIRCLIREFYYLRINDQESQQQSLLKQALQKLNPSGLKDILAEVPKVEWSDIGGYEEIKHEVRRVVEWPLKYPVQFKKLGVQPSKGILLYGPPGCSKTLLARALCTQCNLSFIAVKGPEIFSKYVGDSEKTVREIFKKARICAPSVIFFDEIDAIAPQRQGQTDVQDRVLIQLLTEIDGFESLKNVIIIAATNRPASIDKALLRPGRFDHLVLVDVPDQSARKAIFEVNLQKMRIQEEVIQNIDRLVSRTIGYTGAEICQICREAGLNALSRDINSDFVEQIDFDKAFQKIKPSVTESDRLHFMQFAKNVQI